jgi:hypothetical protein
LAAALIAAGLVGAAYVLGGQFSLSVRDDGRTAFRFNRFTGAVWFCDANVYLECSPLSAAKN